MLFINQTIRQSHSPDRQQIAHARRHRSPNSEKDHETGIEAHSQQCDSSHGSPDSWRGRKFEGFEPGKVEEGDRDGENGEGEETDEGGEEGGVESEGEGCGGESGKGEVFLVDHLRAKIKGIIRSASKEK